MVERFTPAVLVVAGMLGLGACSSDESSSGGGGGNVCGLTCAGSVSCSSGFTGGLSVQNGACVASGSEGTAVLGCDKKISFNDGSSVQTGTWSGSDTSVLIEWNDGSVDSCTVKPPATAGGSG